MYRIPRTHQPVKKKPRKKGNQQFQSTLPPDWTCVIHMSLFVLLWILYHTIMNSLVSYMSVYKYSANESKNIFMMRALYFHSLVWTKSICPVAYYFINKSCMIRNAFSALVDEQECYFQANITEQTYITLSLMYIVHCTGTQCCSSDSTQYRFRKQIPNEMLFFLFGKSEWSGWLLSLVHKTNSIHIHLAFIIHTSAK